jgi:hypothetical protein
MALPPLVTIDEFNALIVGDVKPGDETTRANALIAAASALVRFEAGMTWVDATTGVLTAVPDVAAQITLSAATRAWYNPAQVSSQQLGASSVRYGDVWLTKSEADRLNLLSGKRALSSVNLTPGFGFERDSMVGWAPVDYGGGADYSAADWFPIGY